MAFSANASNAGAVGATRSTGAASVPTPKPTETEEIEAESRPRDGETVAQSLKRSFLSLHARRGAAYGRLRRAVDACATAPVETLDELRNEVCNVTEDLKLVSEGVAALRKGLYYDYLPNSKKVIKWLDRIEKLEERKLVCYASMCTIQRSRAAGMINPEDAPSLNTKIAEYTKELHDKSEELTDILDEIREFIAEELDEE